VVHKVCYLLAVCQKTSKTENATRRLTNGKGVQESSCGVILSYCCVCFEGRERTPRKLLVTTAPTWGRDSSTVPSQWCAGCDNRCVKQHSKRVTLECNQTQMHRELITSFTYPVHLQFIVMRCDVFGLLFDSLFFFCMPQRHKCQSKQQ
jgi:hypothetical protein